MITLTRILVPTNLGEPSKVALRYGVAFARQFGARLFVLHVLRPQDFDAAVEAERVVETLLPDPTQPLAPEPDEVARNAARADLRRLLDTQDERDARVEYLLRAARSGGPAGEITACALENGIDLIIMGKHGLGRVEYMLAGSVTERVVRHASCPVMIVHPQEREIVRPDVVSDGAAE